MDHKDPENDTRLGLRDSHEDTFTPAPEARAALERKLRLRFAAKKGAAE